MVNNLEDIFLDDSFEDLTKQEEKKKVEKLEPEVVKFQEIIAFINKNGREPQKTDEWSEERALWSRLQGFRDKKERAEKVSKYDTLNLLPIKGNFSHELITLDNNVNEVSSIPDILTDDEMFDDFDDLLDISRYKKTINAADKKSSRRHVDNFNQYKSLFDQVHLEIASGQRKIISFEQYDIAAGRFYIQNGVMLYIVSISDDKFIGDNGKENARMHVVYENGTENKQLLLQSLASSLYSTERHGRMVTDIVDDEDLAEGFGEEFTTGYIYVLKSLSTNQEITNINNLYKIGFTRSDIKTRISNAENEVTYLNAPVKVVLTATIKNVNAQILERTLHHTFQDKQIVFQNSEYSKATEWYVVALTEIQHEIANVITRLQG